MAYFDLFPKIVYAQQLVHNITIRTKIKSIIRNRGYAFHTYTIKEGERADQIANRLYGDSNYMWLVYMSNDIVDPQSQWPLSTSALDSFIDAKYGSMSKAKELIVFYRNSWYNSDVNIMPAVYNSYPPEIKRYWNAEYNNTKIIGYARKRVDWVKDTNMIVSMTIASGTGFVKGDKVFQNVSGTNNASAVVEYVDSTHLTVKHVIGTFNNNQNNEITNGSYTTSCISIDGTHYNIPPAEALYWSPVYAYEHEIEQNETKKHIQLIDSSSIFALEKDMKRLLNE